MFSLQVESMNWGEEAMRAEAVSAAPAAPPPARAVATAASERAALLEQLDATSRDGLNQMLKVRGIIGVAEASAPLLGAGDPAAPRAGSTARAAHPTPTRARALSPTDDGLLRRAR